MELVKFMGEGNGTPLQYSCLEKSHGWRGLVGCSPWGRYESDMTERLHFIFSLSCIGEGNGNPLQRSCLENPRDGVAWWAAVYGVAQSQTRLKWLSSSSSSQVQSKQTNIGPKKGKYIGYMLSSPSPQANITSHSQHYHTEPGCSLKMQPLLHEMRLSSPSQSCLCCQLQILFGFDHFFH